MSIQRKPLPRNAHIANQYLEIPRPRSRSLSPSRSFPVLNAHRTYTNPYELVDESKYAVDHSESFTSDKYFTSEADYAESPTTYALPQYATAHPIWSSTASEREDIIDRIDSQTETVADEVQGLEIDDKVSQESTDQPHVPASSKAKLKLVTALEETSIFLGGLIKHPVESTRHFTILRHSHGLVYYRGPNTSITISVFSDKPLPFNRRYWLQNKGWTGNTGMAAKAFFRTNNNWINVTPDIQADVSELPVLDERAWQRDVQKFKSKANKTQQKHKLRETVVVRIPFEANDGYFRVLMTGSDSRQVLCPSPVFRIASTSMSASSLKGASLTALPLEIGIKAAQLAGKSALKTAVAPLATTIQNQLSTNVSLGQYSGDAKTAWNISGLSDRAESTNDKYMQSEAFSAEQETLSTTRTNPTGLSSLGSDEGPESPFPIRLKGTVAQGTSESAARFGKPTANLDTIAPDLLAPLGAGHYFGWAFVSPRDKSQIELHNDWRPAIITILHKQSSAPQIAQRKVVRVYLIYDFPPNTTFTGGALSLLVVSFLRHLAPPDSMDSDIDLALLETINDINIAQSVLLKPAWSHQETLTRVKTAQSARSMTDRIADIRTTGQRQIDRVPIHLFGVRSNTVGVHDRGMYGNGGIWVKRD